MEKYSPFRPEIDFHKLLSDDLCLALVKGSLEAAQEFKFDGLLNQAFRLFVSNSDEVEEYVLVTDKFYLYRKLWQALLERLYSKYLPEYEYVFNWNIEVTPYTLLQCEIFSGVICASEFGGIEKILGVSYEEINSNYRYLLDVMGFSSLGLADGLNDILPDNLIPQSRCDQLNYLFRFMNFPPLEELAVFFMAYGAYTTKQISQLASVFPGINPPKNIGFELKGVIAGAYNNIDHSTFQREKLEGLEAILKGKGFEKNFLEIRRLAADAKATQFDSLVCPCCGESQKIEMPEEISQFALLIQDRPLSRLVGLLFFEDYRAGYIARFREFLSRAKQELNAVDHPSCLILVEGESEEVALPLIATKLGLILTERRIKVFNCKSKQKVYSYFLEFSSKFPKTKIICLLDSDAEKERKDIARIIENKRDRYHLVYIQKGCFEDMFDVSSAVQVLNEIYPGDSSIEVSDFDGLKNFSDNVKRVLHEKRGARLDKVRFAEKISLKISVDSVPKQILEIFEVATKFTEPKNFFAE